MIVLDANILIRAVLGRRVRQFLEEYASRGIRFYAPDVAYADAEKYLPPLLIQRGKSAADVPATLHYLQSLVVSVDAESYGVSEADARERLPGRDEDDWPVLATALALSCAVWTEDTDFFGTGVAVWTSNRIEIFLRRRPNYLNRWKTKFLFYIQPVAAIHSRPSEATIWPVLDKADLYPTALWGIGTVLCSIPN
jgi:predicted nucleic acid-binding protein